MEGEFILLGIIMLIGQIILYQMYQSGWFKKENFKIQKQDMIGEMRLRHKKLAKDLGLQPSKAPKEEKSVVENVGGWVSLLKGLDPDQIKALADKFLGGGEDYEEEEDEDIIGTILKNVDGDTIKSFIDGMGKKTKQDQDQVRHDNY